MSLLKRAVLGTTSLGAAASMLLVAAPANASTAVGNIGYGSTGTGVTCVQAAVGVSVDGIFGAKTKAAVIRFQKSWGLAADGIVGPKTGNDINFEDDVLGYTGCYAYIPTSF